MSDSSDLMLICSIVFGVQCMAHWTNLAIQTLSNLPSVSSIEILIQCLYGYFNHSPKKIWSFPNKESSSLQRIYKLMTIFMIQQCSHIIYVYLYIYYLHIKIIILLVISLSLTCTMLTCVIT
jgi:hypothetical protein